jgi:hypothetical protein
LQVVGGSLLNGNVTFSSATGMFWNAATNRLGIGTNAPAVAFHMAGLSHVGAATTLLLQPSGSNPYIASSGSNSFGVRCSAGVDFANYNGTTIWARVANTGNFIINSSGDTGDKLQVSGTIRTTGNAFFGNYVYANYVVSALVGVDTAWNFSFGSGSVRSGGILLRNFGLDGGQAPNGNVNGLQLSYPFTGATSTFTNVSLLINNTINQTSGTGITRGIYLNPTLTLAFDWRSIEWSNNSGWGLYGAGTAANYINGNLLIGSESSTGEKLQVTGDVKIVSSGTSSATNGLRVLNSASSVLLNARNDGEISIGAGGWLTIGNSQRYIYKGINQTTILSICADSNVGSVIDFYGSSHATKPRTISLVSSFTPTSGSVTFAGFEILNTINQTGGANGITRGLYINPTLTSAADFRAIETTAGKVIFGNLPTSSAGLPTGAIWNDAGTLKIV